MGPVGTFVRPLCSVSCASSPVARCLRRHAPVPSQRATGRTSRTAARSACARCPTCCCPKRSWPCCATRLSASSCTGARGGRRAGARGTIGCRSCRAVQRLGPPARVPRRAVSGPTPVCPRRCREREGAEPNPRDPWATREFYIKWARRSYLHCTWELKSTLSQVGGEGTAGKGRGGCLAPALAGRVAASPAAQQCCRQSGRCSSPLRTAPNPPHPSHHPRLVRARACPSAARGLQARAQLHQEVRGAGGRPAGVPAPVFARSHCPASLLALKNCTAAMPMRRSGQAAGRGK